MKETSCVCYNGGMSNISTADKQPVSPTFMVGDIPVYGDVILAPMDGFSDWPFRSVCRELGSAMSYTEFVKDDFILRNESSRLRKFFFKEEERPIVFQIYGEEPSSIIRAAIKARELNPDIIDVNMGCPAPSIASRGAGVGLMRTPIKVAHIFKELSRALDIPVTGKIRLGWEDCRNHLLIAKIIEDNGGALIAVHARTRKQGLGGEIDLEALSEICNAVKIPVIGNGNIRLKKDINQMKEATGCQGVMVGRGAIENPWIFSGRDRDEIPYEEIRRVVRRHLERNIDFYGEENGQRLFRKHAVLYLLRKGYDRQKRKEILSRKPPEEFLKLLDQINTYIQ